jgi:DNA repair protein RadC
MMLLNRANRVLGIVDIARGGVSFNILDPKVIFSIALKGNASSIILCHNHPSGNLKYSTSDLTMTKRLKECGKMLDIVVNDHIIITNYGYISMTDEGLM